MSCRILPVGESPRLSHNSIAARCRSAICRLSLSSRWIISEAGTESSLSSGILCSRWMWSIDSNAGQAGFSENWRLAASETMPEGSDPLVWELSQLRKTAQGALAYAAKTRNLSATASLLRAAHGLLDLLARIEKAKGEEIKAQQATAVLQDERALEDEFNQHLDRLAERMHESQAMQQPAAVGEHVDRRLDDLAPRMRQAQAAAAKCPRYGQALPPGVPVEEEEPKPAGPGVH